MIQWLKRLLVLKQLNSGKVIAVGPGSRDKAGNLIPVSLKEGDHVLLPEYGGTQIKLDDKEYVIGIVGIFVCLFDEALRWMKILIYKLIVFAGSICLGMRTFWAFCVIDVIVLVFTRKCNENYDWVKNNLNGVSYAI